MPKITRHDSIAAEREITQRRLVSLQRAAEYADCHVNTLRRRIAAGDLPAYRMGPRLLRVDLDDVDRLLRPIPTAGVR